MSAAELVACLGLVALAAYGVLAGADFGSGVWDLFAGGPRKQAQRAALSHAIGPVWEANHVWLIFAVVLMFSAFPRAFWALSVGLFVPLHLVLVGIILRGAAFVFRAYGSRTETARHRWGAVFGAASVVTPWLLGHGLAAISSGALRVRGEVLTVGRVWDSPLGLCLGGLTLAACSYMAAVLMTLETDGLLREDFRRRALASGTVVVALSMLAIPLLGWEAPALREGLLRGRATPCVALGVVAALTSGASLLRRRWGLARAASVAWVALEILGWGVAQYPYLVYPDLTLHNAAAPDGVLRCILWTTPPGLALLLPSLWLLFRVFKGPHAAAEVVQAPVDGP